MNRLKCKSELKNPATLIFLFSAIPALSFAQPVQVKLKLNESHRFSCSQKTTWNRIGQPVDSHVLQTGEMVIKAKSFKNGVYEVENFLSGWRSVSETVQNGNPGGSERDDLVVRSRVKDGSFIFKLTPAGKILNVDQSPDWRSAISVALPLPSKSIQPGDRWVSTLPLSAGVDANKQSVVYEVFEKKKWGKYEVLAIQFSSEPSKLTTDAVSGLLHIDVNTGLTVYGSIKNKIDLGQTIVNVELKLERTN